jgi:hypothetical protein
MRQLSVALDATDGIELAVLNPEVANRFAQTAVKDECCGRAGVERPPSQEVNPVVLLLPSKFQLKSSFGNNHSALQLLARRRVEGTLRSAPQLGVFSTMREDRI